MRIRRWILGSETQAPLKRFFVWIRSRQKRHFPRQLLHWLIGGSRFLQTKSVDENLAVGWFPQEAPDNPLVQGNGIIIHALGPECGEVWLRVGDFCRRTIRGLQNIPMYYFVVLREKGAAYYAASIPDARNIVAAPGMQLLAIDSFHADSQLYAGIHQSALGQIGFRAETRVYGTRIAQLPGFENWYGSAFAADGLRGTGQLDASTAETGGRWKVSEGSLQRTEDGVISTCPCSVALLQTQKEPAGVVHLLIQTDAEPVSGVGLIWRARDSQNYWSIRVGTIGCMLSLKLDGRIIEFPTTTDVRLLPNAQNSLQVSDDGASFALYLNGDRILGNRLHDSRLAEESGLGFEILDDDGRVTVQSIEGHPRVVPIPDCFDLGKAWIESGNRVVAGDNFDGGSGDLAGRTTPTGGLTWQRPVGTGVFELTGNGKLKVRGSLKEPCPGRTAYTVPWSSSGFADIAVRITPPGTGRGQRERGRGGIIIWQDAANYLTFSAFVDDYYGFSIAAFFHIDGYEELFDAIWTNLGDRVFWGIPYDFRVVFNGETFLCYVNGEPVLYRALSDIYPHCESLSINQVGLVANWEWGNDTGTLFENFNARDKS
ncbi:MAG: hypothetical protein R3F07_10755 [Opitutaceae bacterium]